MVPEDFVVVLITAASLDEASRIGRRLVESRLAACANVVGPIRSIFRWEGAIENQREHLLLVKARAADVPPRAGTRTAGSSSGRSRRGTWGRANRPRRPRCGGGARRRGSRRRSRRSSVT